MTIIFILERRGRFGHTETQRRQCEDGDRDWNNGSTNQGLLGATRSWKKQECFPPRNVGILILDFSLSVL